MFAKRIRDAYEQKGNICVCLCKGRDAAEWGIPVLEGSLKEWTGNMFRECDSLLVMDEQGHFVISLLSGHLGGANALTREIAALVGAVPVITTATDAGGRFSVDDFARREHLYLDSLPLAKAVAADILEQRTIGLYSDFEVVGQIPPELSIQKKDGLGISISVDETYDPFPRTLHLVPRIAVLGIGCKRGTPVERIEALVEQVLLQNQLSKQAIARVASRPIRQRSLKLWNVRVAFPNPPSCGRLPA